MGCGCKKRAAVRAASEKGPITMGTPTRIYFYAVPPAQEAGSVEQKFRVLKDARAVAKANKGWIVQQRRETVQPSAS